MKIWGRYQKHWPLAVLVAAVTAAAVASAQSVPSTEYRYDNNGNLHRVLLTCNTGSVLCGVQCVPSDVNNCGSCGNVCPTVLNGYATCPASQCGLACATGYSLNGSTCALQFLSMALDISTFATTYSGTVRWTTNAPATTRIRYRAVSNDRVSADPWTDVMSGAGLSTSHVATMIDLFPVADYEYQAISTDGGGATFYSGIGSFGTPKGAYDVGVISYQDNPGLWATACPGQKGLVRIYLDNEDYKNTNSRSGWIGGIGSDSNGTRLPFCRINGQKLKPLTTNLNTAYEYAVLSLSGTCPNESVSFWRHFDTEDGNNASRSWPDPSRSTRTADYQSLISPNYLDASYNVRLFFCMFRNSATPMDTFPSISQPYGVFAPSDFARAIKKGWVYTDDEDTNTGNAYGSLYPAESQRIVADGNNTYLYTAQVACGPSSASIAGQTCGSCGGIILCDGLCSVATPGNFGQACGSCGGKVQCDGSCSVATPGNLGQTCGLCGGSVLCDGSCSVATPVTFGQACGSCGGIILCDGSCSVATPVTFGQACGSCGGIQTS